MSHSDQPNEPAAPEGAHPAADQADLKPMRPPRPAPAPRPHGGGSLALAMLLALLALGASGYTGWRLWQQQRGSAADAALQQRVSKLETSVSALNQQRSGLDQQLDDANQVNRSLREELLNQAERTRHLEDAVANLAAKNLSGHDEALLDETESLLRMADERYTLFHDAQGAATAYALADQTLAGVNDGNFSNLRQSISAERDALQRSQPASQAGALQQLSELRSTLATLPLKPLDTPSPGQAATVWSRIKQALARVVIVQRDNGAPLAVADARFTRELAELDLAQAQAALLAYDSKAYAAALQRVDASLASQFDTTTPAVRQARATLKQLADALPVNAPVQLGSALTELHNLRALHALSPASTSSSPASAASVAPAAGARP